MIGRTLGGATVAVMQGLLVTAICVIAGFRPTTFAAIPLALVFMLLIALVFAALGVAIGSSLQDMQGFQLIMNFLVMPIFFLSGALFPLAGCRKLPMRIATTIDPLSYGVDGMRRRLLGTSFYGRMLDFMRAGGAGLRADGHRRVAVFKDRDLGDGEATQRRSA